MAWEENSRICLHMQLIAILSRTGVKYKRVSWHDDRFYTKDIRTNKIQINQNYIEIVIKDYATFVVCQTDNGYKILEPIQK